MEGDGGEYTQNMKMSYEDDGIILGDDGIWGDEN